MATPTRSQMTCCAVWHFPPRARTLPTFQARPLPEERASLVRLAWGAHNYVKLMAAACTSPIAANASSLDGAEQ
eukprot:8088759-Pyramimonas_sp.AAC.1